MDLTRFLLAGAGLLVASGASAAASDEPIRVRCLEGRCFLRRFGQIYVEPLSRGRPVTAERGDTVLTVAQGSLLEVDFGERKGQAYLRDVSLAQINQGSERVTLGSNVAAGQTGLPASASTGGSDTGSEEVLILPSISAGNLSFFRDLSVQIVTPPPGGALLVESLPAPGRIVLEVTDKNLIEAFLERHAKWTLRHEAAAGTAQAAAADLSLIFTPVPGSPSRFEAPLEWPVAGDFVLIPQGSDGRPAAASESSLRVRVASPESWAGEVEELIQKATSGEELNGEVEVRTP
jgi:hypothetical protein